MFIYYVIYPIYSIKRSVRILIFGPSIDESLLKLVENRPKDGVTLYSDGVSWWYRDGKWQHQPKRIGLTKVGVINLEDGTLLDYEEWTNEKGEIERKY